MWRGPRPVQQMPVQMIITKSISHRPFAAAATGAWHGKHIHPPFFHSGCFSVLNPKGLRDCGCLPVGIHQYRRHTRSGKLPRANRSTTRRRRPRAVVLASPKPGAIMNGSKGTRGMPFKYAAAIVPQPTATSSVEA